MSKLKIYEYSGCGTCKKAQKFLKENAVDYTGVPIRETPPSKTELKKMLKLYEGNIRKLFNTSGRDYKELKLSEKLPSLSDAEAIDLLAGTGNLVKRPFALTKDGGRVGFKEDEWKELLGL
jgi:arsenate reductase (glutaredoxin)